MSFVFTHQLARTDIEKTIRFINLTNKKKLKLDFKQKCKYNFVKFLKEKNPRADKL